VLASGAVTTPALRIVRAPPGLVWRALDGEEVAGAVTAFLRPDDRWFVHLDPASRADSYGPLLAAVAESTSESLYTTVEETDDRAMRLFCDLGFTVNRRESSYVVPTDPELTGLRDGADPEGVVVISAVDAWEDELRWLDDALRQDVPGTDGWKWDPGDFREETFGRHFDPATYLVAVGAARGDYIGLVRVWDNPGRPRLGLIAVLRPYRRRGLASLLLGRVFRVLHERGQAEVTAEVDDTNVASRALLQRLGARRAGGAVEMVRTGPPPEGRADGQAEAGDGRSHGEAAARRDGGREPAAEGGTR
jgi:ribosomal protein S18 acetylase RimI-like enzyme